MMRRQIEKPSRDHLTLEQYQARAARWYAAGADGLHLFNESRHEIVKGLGSVPAAKPNP